MTTAEWSEMESFEAVFYELSFQEELQKGVKKNLQDYVFLIGEILASSVVGKWIELIHCMFRTINSTVTNLFFYFRHTAIRQTTKVIVKILLHTNRSSI